MEKTYKNQQEKFKEFWDSMKLIEWEPEPAMFQLSKNRKYGRHDDWKFLRETDQKRIAEGVWKAWGLQLALDDGFYAYFLQPWERTRLVDFVGDIEETAPKKETPPSGSDLPVEN